VQPGADPQSELEQLVADVYGAADRASGAVEHGRDAVGARLDLAAVIAVELAADRMR